MISILDRLKKSQIQICGDAGQNVAQIESVLAAEGYQNIRTAIGLSCDFLLRAIHQPDILILAPTAVGQQAFEAVERLSGIVRDKVKVPLLVLAPELSAECQIRLIEHGASGVVTWPGRPDEFLSRVHDKLAAFLLHEDGECRGTALERRLQELTSQLRETEARARHLRDHDLLTGLPNYVLLRERLADAVSAARKGGHKLSLLLVDIDRFRDIVCDLDYQAGDQLLWEGALRISECAGPDAVVGRVGHSEFAVILPVLERPIDAEILARNLLGALSTPFGLDQSEVILSGSIGIAIFPDGCESCTGCVGALRTVEAENMMSCASKALQRSQQSGGGGFRFATNNVASRRSDRQLEVDLSRAIKREEFALYFQPIIEIESGKVSGAEALLRWRRPSGELVPPATFMGLAETSGLIVPIGEWVMQAACRQVSKWSQGPFSELSVSVNLSPRQCRDTKFVEAIETALDVHKVDPKLIVLEVTENVLLERDNQCAIAGLHELREGGIRIALDDFGSGYSSFGYLNDFSFDVLKIDRSFIQKLSQNGVNEAIVRAICAMAHTLGLTVVAEGAETEQQVRRIRDSLCDRIQGHYFCPPVPADEFEDFFMATKTKRRSLLPGLNWEMPLPLADVMPALH